MAVFRINKARDYTVMSNHHLRNTSLSLKAKGLLSLMLSLPDNWDYTTKGLASICKDVIDSICSAVKELEQHGYIVRERVRNDKGQLTTIEYTILEQPETALPEQEKPKRENPVFDNPEQENPAQLNTNISNTKKSNTNTSTTYPIKSYQKDGQTAQKRGKDKMGYDEMNAYRQLIKENIEYDILSVKLKPEISMLDEIVDLLTETVCTKKDSLVIAGDVYPTAVVKSKLLKLDAGHIEYVIDCMKSNTTEVRNIKKYLLAALFNAPSTMDSYYTARVNHDLYGHE